VTPDANGVGLETALEGYATWTKTTLLPGCMFPTSSITKALLIRIDCQNYGYTDENDLSCLNTYNASSLLFTDRTVGNAIDRQWNWMLCNEPFAYWQE
jgi:hypothetical protein